MKSSLKMTLLSGPAWACLFLFFILINSCGGPNQTPAVSPALAGTFPLALRNVKDTSGSQPILHTSMALPAGSPVQLICKNCTDSSGNSVGSKVLFSGTLDQTIPVNTELVLRVVSNDIK